MPKRRPRLSETLTGPRDLGHCQSCGIAGESDLTLTRWMEHDENDQREPIVVVLCDACGDRLIEPHPRVYEGMSRNEPMPGAMPVCVGCRHQQRLRCVNPAAKINGGSGLSYQQAPPSRGFIDYRSKGGRRRGHSITIYHEPVRGCSGREEDPS